MSSDELVDSYRNYIACLNAQNWPDLGRYVHREAVHNERPLGLIGYIRMLENDFDTIPDLRFNIGLLIADPPTVASRLDFDCTPKGLFLDLPVNGRKVSFTENVFYRYLDGKIAQVWSIVDKAAIERQL